MSLRVKTCLKVAHAIFGTRVIAACVVALFCFQFARFYLVIPLDQFLCLEANHTHTGAASHSHDHHHDSEEALPHSHNDNDTGYYFQHCKDTFEGMALTPVQPLGMPAAVSVRQPEIVVAIHQPEERQFFESFLAPPFQPPRA